MSLNKHIIEGYKNGYNQLWQFNPSGGDFTSKATEYLFTVNVAQQLIQWKTDTNSYFDEIRIEYSTKELKNRCFTSYKEDWTNIFEVKTEYRADKTPVRSGKGKIDIAVLGAIPEEIGYSRSLYGIEIKSLIGTDMRAVKPDIERLIDLLTCTDPIGTNSLKECYLIYSKRFDKPDKIYQETKFNAAKSLEINNVENLLNSISSINSVDYVTEPFDLSVKFADEYIKTTYTPDKYHDESDVAQNTGAVIGVLISLKRKNND